jgi:HSP20 family molecular chaperone IbpA
MYLIDYTKLFEDFYSETTPTWKTSRTTTYSPSKFAVDIKDDVATMALSVIGHDPKNVEINCFVDKIEVKSKKQSDTESPFDQLTSNIDEVITLGKDLDGTKSKAEIKNGILMITVEKKDESKPKKLTPKVG